MRSIKEIAIACGIALTLELGGLPSAMAVIYPGTAPAAAAQTDALLGDEDEEEDEGYHRR